MTNHIVFLCYSITLVIWTMSLSQNKNYYISQRKVVEKVHSKIWYLVIDQWFLTWV